MLGVSSLGDYIAIDSRPYTAAVITQFCGAISTQFCYNCLLGATLLYARRATRIF